MKVGDLVKDYRGEIGVVVGYYPQWDTSPTGFPWYVRMVIHEGTNCYQTIDLEVVSESR